MTSPIRTQLATLKAKREEAAARLTQRYAARQQAQSLAKDLANRDLAARSLREQIESIQASLTGLTPEDRLTLDREKTYSSASRIVSAWTESVGPIRGMLTDLRQRAETNAAGAASAISVAEPEIFAEIFAEYRSVMASVSSLAAQLDKELEAFVKRQADPLSPLARWGIAIEAFKRAYLEAMQRSSAHKERVAELEQLNTRLNQHHIETSRIQEQLNGLQGAETEFETERASWVSLRQEQDRLMDGQCGVLTQNSAGGIRASMRRLANADGFVQRLRDFLSGSNIRRDKLEGIGTAITTAADPLAAWQIILRDLETLANFKSEDELSGQRPNTPALTSAGLSGADLDKISARLAPANWLELSLAEIDSEPVFEYQSRENDYIPFKNASSGQQATVLLKTLLNEAGPPLVIDQPEEDLDNPVISEIVEQIWASKQKRQIIFASHNANLVVNGDAELVVWCDYRKAGDQSGGKIMGEGAIDVPLVRDAIKRIMEGGEAAFKARREKYGF